MLESNPFAAPQAEPEWQESGPEQSSESDLWPEPWDFLIEWEKLRLGYLAVLSVMAMGCLIVTDRHTLSELNFWFKIVVGFIGANLCFTAGPALEVAFWYLGAPANYRRWMRSLVFALGTLFSVALTNIYMIFVAPI